MKRLIINTIAVCLFILISSVTFAQSTSEMKASIAKMNQEMIDLAKIGNYDAMNKYYDDNAVSLPNYRAKESGYKTILNNNLGRQKGGYKIVDGKKTTTELITGEDMMVDVGTYTLTVTFPGLAEPKVDNGKYMNVWKKNKAGEWKLVAETWNADKSPATPAGKGQAQTGASVGGKTVVTPVQGTTTKTTEKQSTQSGTTKTITAPASGTTTKTTTGTSQKTDTGTKDGKK